MILLGIILLVVVIVGVVALAMFADAGKK